MGGHRKSLNTQGENKVIRHGKKHTALSSNTHHNNMHAITQRPVSLSLVLTQHAIGLDYHLNQTVVDRVCV